MKRFMVVVCLSAVIVSTVDSPGWCRQPEGGSTDGGGAAPVKRSLDDIRNQLKQKRSSSHNEGSEFAGGMSGSGPGMGGPGMGTPGMAAGMGSGSGMAAYGGSSLGGDEMGGGPSAEGAMGSGMVISEPTDKQLLTQLIQKLRDRLSSKNYNRAKVEKQLRAALEQYFNADLEERLKEFDKVKARINEMEIKLQRRLDSETEIVELQLKQMLHKADGLDFSIPNAAASGMGMGMGGGGYGGEGGMGMGGMSSMGPGGLGEAAMSGMGGDAGYADRLELGYDSTYGMTRFQRIDADDLDDSDPLKSYAKTQSSLGTETPAATDEQRLKSILLAFHQFEARFKHLPRSVNRHFSDQPAHSWRVAILPLIGEGQLYQEYQFDQPWNSKANMQVAEKMPAIFRSDAQKNPNTTQFKMIVGAGGFDSSRNPPTFASITDGTSNTLMIIQSNNEVPWTKPEDISHSANGPLPALSAARLAGFADGHVMNLPRIDEIIFRAMLTRSGGEAFEMPE